MSITLCFSPIFTMENKFCNFLGDRAPPTWDLLQLTPVGGEANKNENGRLVSLGSVPSHPK